MITHLEPDILQCEVKWAFISVQSLSCVQLFVTPWTSACQASLSITNSQSLLKLMSIESVMPCNYLILWWGPYETSLQTKLVEVMGFQLNYFKPKKMMLWKCCTQYYRKFGKLSSGHRTGKGQFSFQSQRKGIPKNVQTTAQL